MAPTETTGNTTHTTPPASINRSLVLGGGGMVGIAWLAGVLSGLAEEGIDLCGPHAPNEVIGTSAGSVVGALVAQRVSPARMQELAMDPGSVTVVETATSKLDMLALIDCLGVWGSLPDDSPASLSRVGKLAVVAQTMDEAEWVHAMAPTIGTQWPANHFACTAVNAETGEFVLWSADHAVALDVAVASSCTVPCIFPAVSIGDGRYVDGGVRSGTSADVATGKFVLILAPMGSNETDPLDAGAKVQIARESALLQERGAHVVTLLPDADTNAATLTSPLGRMDPAMREPAIAHGIRQGRALASELTNW